MITSSSQMAIGCEWLESYRKPLGGVEDTVRLVWLVQVEESVDGPDPRTLAQIQLAKVGGVGGILKHVDDDREVAVGEQSSFGT